MEKRFFLMIPVIIFLFINSLSGCFEQGNQNTSTNPGDTESPSIPGNVRCTTPKSLSTPVFSWDASTDSSGIAGYYITIDTEKDIWVGNVLTWKSPSIIADGTHTFSIKAKDKSTNGNNGSYGSCSFLIHTSSVKQNPVANPNGPYTGFINQSITFDGTMSGDIDGTIVNYSWDFTDGTILYGGIVTHSYNKSGAYNVTLTVKDNDGLINTNTTIANITVYSEGDNNPDGGGDSGSNPAEQELFLGSWHTIEGQTELWVFYGNGTRKTTSYDIDDATQEPYPFTVWSFYQVANKKICFHDIDTPNEQPSICYDYTFSENNTILAMSFNGVVVISLERD
jgi:hypothetical protein